MPVFIQLCFQTIQLLKLFQMLKYFTRCPLGILVTTLLFAGTYQHEPKILTKDLKLKLRSGDLMPAIGLGTYFVQGEQVVKDVLDKAFTAGYRAIDTATLYENEEDIGKALKVLLPKHNLTRQDIFITTKLVTRDQGEKAYQAIEKSLSNLGCDYIDLYLIHSPGRNKSEDVLKRLRDQSWQQLVKAVKDGLVKNIGVSNYIVRHLKELLANDHGMKPAVNQVEFHPYYHRNDLLDFCRKEGILLEAYFSLGGTDRNDLLTIADVKNISEKIGKTPAQVLLRWSLQQNIAIIPKARSLKHLEENIDLNFEISEEDMKILNSFPQKILGNEYL